MENVIDGYSTCGLTSAFMHVVLSLGNLNSKCFNSNYKDVLIELQNSQRITLLFSLISILV